MFYLNILLYFNHIFFYDKLINIYTLIYKLNIRTLITNNVFVVNQFKIN